jgi:hypothetical protein
MSKTRKWMVGVVCVVLMALLAPMAWALDVCNQPVLFIASEPAPVDIYCPTGYTIVSNSTVNLLPGAHISEAIGGAPGTGILTVDASVSNTINVYGGQIDTSLNTTSLDLVTFYGSDFAVDGVLLDPSQDQIVNTGASTYSFTLSGVYEDDSLINIPCDLETGGEINLAWLGGPSVIDVIVDIKPDSEDNTINLGSMGVIPVGILSTADFDATQVDPWTVELAGAGVAVRGKGSKLLSSVKDLNGDGLMDIEVKVETENLDPGTFQDGIAVLTGQTYDGLEIQGQDSITIVPE